MSHRRQSLVLDHLASALGPGGIRCLDWTRSPVVATAGVNGRRGRELRLGYRPRLVYLAGHIPRIRFWAHPPLPHVRK